MPPCLPGSNVVYFTGSRGKLRKEIKRNNAGDIKLKRLYSSGKYRITARY
jgi:hypothetical protein